MAYTSNVDRPMPSAKELLDACENVWRELHELGTLHGQRVLICREDRTLRVGDAYTVSVDHPYIAGTPMHASALRFLGEA